MTPQVDGLTRLTDVGRGGFGVVYRAWQEELSRFVAVKVLTGTLDERAARRFTQECRALGAVSGHPNIVPVYSAGTTEAGEPYLVMPFCEGGSLAQRMQAQRLPWTEAVHVGVLLAGALHTAHEAGILHRDIKPGNILADAYGNPMLADFGLARIVGAEISRTSSIVATPAYAAPEILGGAAAGRSADVYSLAATVLTLIAGHPPFDRPSTSADTSSGGHLAATVYRVLHEPPVDLRERDVPDAVCAVLERAMSKDPQDRPDSALELALALRDAQLRLGVPASTPPVTDGVPGERTTSAPAPTRPAPAPATKSTVDDLPGTARPPAPPRTKRRTRRQTSVLPRGRRLPAGPVALVGVAVLAFVALFFVVPRNEITPRGVAAGTDAGLLGPGDYGVSGLRRQPGAASAFRDVLGTPTARTPTPVSRCVGLPLRNIRSWQESAVFGTGDPARIAVDGRSDLPVRYAVQSAVLHMAGPADATAMITNWPDAFGSTCRDEIILAGLVRAPGVRDPLHEGSVTGLAESVRLPAGTHYRGHRVDVRAGKDVNNNYVDYYADFTLIARGATVVVAVVNSSPEPPDEIREAVDTALLRHLTS